MIALIALSTAIRQSGPSIDSLLGRVNQDLKASLAADLKGEFQTASDADYMLEMARVQGGLSSVQAEAVPVPPGWTGYGRYWIVFSHWQNIELTADAVYEVHLAGDKYAIGQEVKEDYLGGWKIDHVTYSAVLHPDQGSVDVNVDLKLHSGPAKRALPFRLNTGILPASQPGMPVIVETPDKVVTPTDGSLVRAGGLMIPWTSQPKSEYKFSYTVKPPKGAEDSIASDHAYVTADWIPSLGRLPFTVDATVTGPAKWKIRCEGVQSSRTVSGDSQTVSYSCPLAISFPKIIGGEYTLAASDKHKGQTFNVWQLAPVEKDNAENSLKQMERGADYFQSILGPLPFPGYSLYDSNDYYGIESYSHTLLQKDATHFVTHEMGHSYFGGIVPCSYLNDAWNEGLTEYLDSVLLNDDRDRSLENAMQSINVTTPLSQMRICWDYSNAAYMRGCYVMKMLESVIGKDKVIAGLHQLVQSRRGVPTQWDDLRQYFEKTSGQDLSWFWNQWVDNGVFPNLTVMSVKSVPDPKGYKTTVVIEQSGTEFPFRLKFQLIGVFGDKQVPEQTVDMTAPQQMYVFTSAEKPLTVSLGTFPLTLVHTAKN